MRFHVDLFRVCRAGVCLTRVCRAGRLCHVRVCRAQVCHARVCRAQVYRVRVCRVRVCRAGTACLDVGLRAVGASTSGAHPHPEVRRELKFNTTKKNIRNSVIFPN